MFKIWYNLGEASIHKLFNEMIIDSHMSLLLTIVHWSGIGLGTLSRLWIPLFQTRFSF